MKIVRDTLTNARPLKLKHEGRRQTPNKLVIHYTAGDTLAAAVSALNRRGLSYHVIVEPNGTIHQTRPFTEHAAHAGRSNWKPEQDLANASSLNQSSIGVVFVNRGFFGLTSGESYYDADAHGTPIGRTYPASAVETTASIYDPENKRHWHRYTDDQLRLGREIAAAVIEKYPTIDELVGHDDIAIDGKFDPGPLFPLGALKHELQRPGTAGFRTTVKSPDAKLPVRRRPNSRSKELTSLNHGATVFLRAVVYTTRPADAILVDSPGNRYLTAWASVDTDGSNTHAGFVHMRFLARTPLNAALAAKL